MSGKFGDGQRDGGTRPLRVGLIGCGKMGMNHLRAINTIAGVTVVGVVDPLMPREALDGLLPAETRLTGHVDELLAMQPDVVHIVTPPSTHAELAMRALRAGCHVYVEKPFTPSRAEAAAVLELAAERGLLVCAGHQYLFERPALVARESLASIGTLVHVESYFSFRTARRTITPGDQARDILPHAVYPLVDQLRQGSGLADVPIELSGIETRANGDVYALLRLGDCTGILLVTLNGRPVEQYQHLVGTAGWMRADYITGSVTTLLGPGAGLGVLFTPYRRAFQTLTGATAGFAKLLTRKTSYPGLQLVIDRFYRSISERAESPVSPRSILDTVEICEQIGGVLGEKERRAEAVARDRIAADEHGLPALKGHTALVTGGTGLLGKRVAQELRSGGIKVRVLARRLPVWSARIAGVDYVVGDLAQNVDPALLDGVTTVVHCAAETAGAKDDHERNSITATQNIVEAAAKAGVRRFVHVSSLAVLKPGSSSSRPLDETSPVDGSLERGPYVWGKAKSEAFVQQRCTELGIEYRIVRPGPLVDYGSFIPPGRLGREVGPLFVVIGSKGAPLSVCDIGTAARVLRSYVQDLESAPPLVNLVEAPPPTRGDLVRRIRSTRPDLGFFWFPAWLLRILSPVAVLAQRVLLGSKKPIDVYGAFAVEHYRTDLAASVIDKAGPSMIRSTTGELIRA